MARTLSTVTLGPLDRAGPEATAASTPATLRRRWSRLSQADRWALALLVTVPVVLNVPPALLGRPVMDGDNLTQNYPLRVLSGELLRHGRLPLWDPYIWSGTPLLAGWNAGAMFPGTWLFAVLPGIAAWTVNLVLASVVCGVGLHLFLRRLGCSPLASFLGAATFTYTGFMTGQANHFGLIAGMSFAPWMLLAIDELGERPGPRAARRWVALLGACGGLVVLAGDPRSVSSVAIAVGIYCLAVCWRQRRRARRWIRPFALAIAASIILAIGLSAVQWLPGLSFLHESERAADTFSRFAAGSLSWPDLTLLFVPFIVGGYGNFGLPIFQGAYNLPELSYAVGILPLIAAFALARRALRRRPDEVPVGVWYVLGIVGMVLSAGGNTPLGHVLAAIPLYGGQRLQNRNAVLVDLALAVLLAIFVDMLSSRAASRAPGIEGGPPTPLKLSLGERLAGLVPVGVVVFLIIASYVLGHWIQRILGVFGYSPRLAGNLTRYYVLTLVIAAGAALVLIAASRLSTAARRRLVTIVVLADISLSLAGVSYAFPEPATLARTNPPVNALAALLGTQGRYAIFNPAQNLPIRYVSVIHELGPYDLGILHQLSSVQGYGSAVAGSYEDATGAHEVENLQPAALTQSNLDILNLRELVTLPQYLIAAIPGNRPIPIAQGTPVPPGTAPVAVALNAIAPLKPLPLLPPSLLTPGASSTWMLPGPIALDSATIVLVPYNYEIPATVTLGILNAVNQIVDVRQVPVVDSKAQIALGGRVVYGVQVGALSGASAGIGAVAVTTADPMSVNSGALTRRIVLNQVLQGVLEPPRWRFQTEIGGLPVFTDTMSRGAAWMEPAGSTTPFAPTLPFAHAATRTVPPWQDPVTAVSSPQPAVLVRSAAYEAGWVARLTPIGGGPSFTEQVRSLGIVQAISVPPGRFLVTWIYTSKRATLGLLVSGVSALALVLVVIAPRRRRKWGSRRIRSPYPGPLPEADLERGAEPVPSGSPLAVDFGHAENEGASPA